MKFGIVVFPGSDCGYDCHHVLSQVLEAETVFIWHGDKNLKNCDCVVLPGVLVMAIIFEQGLLPVFRQ